MDRSCGSFLTVSLQGQNFCRKNEVEGVESDPLSLFDLVPIEDTRIPEWSAKAGQPSPHWVLQVSCFYSKCQHNDRAVPCIIQILKAHCCTRKCFYLVDNSPALVVLYVKSRVLIDIATHFLCNYNERECYLNFLASFNLLDFKLPASACKSAISTRTLIVVMTFVTAPSSTQCICM